MRYIFAALVGGLVVGATIAVSASTVFPPVSVLQEQLHAVPGGIIPKDVYYAGHLFHPRYMGAHALANGKYAIIVQLDR